MSKQLTSDDLTRRFETIGRLGTVEDLDEFLGATGFDKNRIAYGSREGYLPVGGDCKEIEKVWESGNWIMTGEVARRYPGMLR